MNRYLPVTVLSDRCSGTDCTNGGVTATNPRQLVVPCFDGHVTEEDVSKFGYIVLESRTAHIPVGNYPRHFVPAGESRRGMFGGNYVTSSDSRFGKMYGHSPIAVHDRYER